VEPSLRRTSRGRDRLRGVEGWVEQRYGMTTVLLRVDFLSQAAAVKVEAHQLELI